MVMRNSSNIPGFFALIIITLTFFVAVFAYYLAPDSSPYANEMHLELSLLEPQTEVTFIKLRNDNTTDVSFFHRLIYGEKMNYRSVPVNSFTIKENELEYVPYNSSYSKKLMLSHLDGNTPDIFSYVRIFYLGTDKYGRKLGRLYWRGKDINRELVSAGYAWVYDQYVTDNSFYEDQSKARENRLGLWSDLKPVEPWNWRKLNK